MKNTITYFMWGYQRHFNRSLKYNIQTLLESIGIDDINLDTFLVGIRSPELSDEGFPICIEPEDGNGIYQFLIILHKNFQMKLKVIHLRICIIRMMNEQLEKNLKILEEILLVKQ